MKHWTLHKIVPLSNFAMSWYNIHLNVSGQELHTNHDLPKIWPMKKCSYLNHGYISLPSLPED